MLVFTLLIVYLLCKYSVHYFSFLAASVSGGKSTVFILQQFKKDLLETFSLLLRFYILLFRMNVYDTLEDCLDGYYIFVGDFDDDQAVIDRLNVQKKNELSQATTFDNNVLGVKAMVEGTNRGQSMM